MLIKFCHKAIVTWRFICLRIYRLSDTIERYFRFTKVKMVIGYFLSVRDFGKKFSSSSFGSCLLGAKCLTNFVADLKMSLGLIEYFDSLSSVYNLDIA